MKWEVERQVPFNASESIVDFKKIERPEGYAEGQNMDVLLAVAQQDMVDRHVEMLFAAGLKPFAIDVEPLAGGRALLELTPDYGAMPGHTVAVINIGAINTDVAIFRDKLLAFPRTLPLAGENFTRAIADALGVDMTTAETYKREYAEVIFGQDQQQANPFGGSDSGNFGGGFMDFGAAPEPVFVPPVEDTQAPLPVTPAGSGKMPFDFSTPGDDAPLPEPSGPLESAAFAPTPFDMSGNTSAEPSPSSFMTPGTTVEEPFAAAPAPFDMTNQFAPAPDFSPSPAPDNGNNLPVTALAPQSGDPAREAMRVQVFNAIAPVLAELVQEIRRSVDFYRGRSIDPTIHEMLLIGGTARLPNLAPFLEAELGIPTRVADPLQHIKVSTKNFSAGHLDSISSMFPVSIGLGARDLVAAPAAKKTRQIVM